MSVLECARIHDVVYTRENLVPFVFVLTHRHGVVFRQGGACGHHCFFPVDPRRDERGQAARHVLALLAERVECLYGAFCLAAYLGADVPAAEAFVA